LAELILLAQPVPPHPDAASLVSDLAELLRDRGLAVSLVPELYHVPDESPLWEELRQWPGAVRYVTHLHARPVAELLRQHGVGAAGLEVVSLRDHEDAAAVAEVLGGRGVSPRPEAPPEQVGAGCPSHSGGEGPVGAGCPSYLVGETTEVRERWYPVLDLGRCVGCGHCHEFCLFGVYERDEAGKVRVARPDQCKAGCPACSRVCPEGAIIFPRYERDPAISGAPGQFVVLDAEGRKLFYHRTKAVCPRCGQSGEFKREPGEACAECGRPITPAAPPPAARDQLDALLDQLEDLARGDG
jgi:NAD-dependent dihydropyrimidine dehydrogenase PreA subunit